MPKRKAFTMVEMMIVVGVIAVLVGLALAAYSHLVNSAASKSTGSALHLAQSLFAEYEQSASTANLGFSGGQRDFGFPYPQGYRVDTTLVLPLQKAAPIGLGTPVIAGSVSGGNNDNRYPAHAKPNTDFTYDKDLTVPKNAVYNTAAVMMYLARNPQVHQIIASIPPRSLLQVTINGGKPVVLVVTNTATGSTELADAPILVDGWLNPIIYVPPGGLVVSIKGAGAAAATTYLVRTSGTTPYDPTKPPPPPLSSTDRPFFASAGPDGNFDFGDDNVYSFQQ